MLNSERLSTSIRTEEGRSSSRGLGVLQATPHQTLKVAAAADTQSSAPPRGNSRAGTLQRGKEWETGPSLVVTQGQSLEHNSGGRSNR